MPAIPAVPGSRFSRTPALITASAQATCSPSRSRADRPRVSSRAPASISVIAAAEMASISWSTVVVRPSASTKAESTATPPSFGVGVLCLLRASG